MIDLLIEITDVKQLLDKDCHIVGVQATRAHCVAIRPRLDSRMR